MSLWEPLFDFIKIMFTNRGDFEAIIGLLKLVISLVKLWDLIALWGFKKM